MELLTEIFCNDNLNLHGKVITRKAVRGIIFNQHQLLMVYSKKNGDYKFPGGGVKPGENPKSALIREVKEECGASIEGVESEFGKVIEYDLPLENGYDLFKMTSSYYICKISNKFVDQQLDHYEKFLGFMPRWVSLDEALNTNQMLLNERDADNPRWVKRETIVLEILKRRILDKG